jgi:hypothetical protein
MAQVCDELQRVRNQLTSLKSTTERDLDTQKSDLSRAIHAITDRLSHQQRADQVWSVHRIVN